MKPSLFSPLAVLFFFGLHLEGASGPQVRDGEVAARLVSPFASVEPGQKVPVGVRFEIDDGWHTYWRNPGDTGQTTYVSWELPDGAVVGDLRWPYPEIYRNAHLVDFTYSHEVTLYADITVPKTWPVGQSFPISASVDWLMCADICIPGSATLSLELPVATRASTDPVENEAFVETQRGWPKALDGLDAELRATHSELQFRIAGLTRLPDNLAGLHLFPVDPVAAPSGDQSWRVEDGILIGDMPRSEYAENLPGEVKAVLVADGGWPAAEGASAIALTAHVSGEAPTLALGSAGGSTGGGLFGLLALAFAGGAVLNLMPCVFPVLGLKIMGFVQQAGNERRKIVGHGLLFTSGVVVSFWVLAGVLLALRAGGAELGWGFQLQSAGFVFGMAAFLFLFALNLSGVFEIGFGLAAAGSRAEKGEGPWGSFLSGVLATIVATPCSAPFLAAALAGALTLPATVSFLTFTFIALGLATPYLLLSLFPALLRKLPRPGAWMESLKQFMAFPLYATTGWLIFVLAGQVDGGNLLAVLLSLSGLALAAWVFGRFGAPHRRKTLRRLAVAAAFVMGAASLAYGFPRKSDLEWVPWSPETVAELREDGRIVYVDFTARWCATCQVNKTVVFGSGKILTFVAEEDVALVKADWTNEDPAITRRLLELGKAAVPVNLVYLPGRDEPEILPETLTPGIVLRALRGE